MQSQQQLKIRHASWYLSKINTQHFELPVFAIRSKTLKNVWSEIIIPIETHVYRMCKKATENEMKFVGYLLPFTKCLYPKNR